MMCGRYAIFTEEENEEIRQVINELNERYKSETVKPEFKTGEIFPTDTVPAITAASTGKNTVSLFKWGFPGFAQNSSVIINARSETLYERPLFRRLITNNRCLLPASAFYEWKKANSKIPVKKEKHIISLKGETMFYMAGLYNTFTGKHGEQFNAFVIITTQANNEISWLHDRMPVIIRRGLESLWLDSNILNQRDLNLILEPRNTSLVIAKD